MPKNKAVSPARSQGGITTPKRKATRGSRSLCSPALSTASGRLTSLIDQFKDKNMESFALSPLNGRSVLNDNTEIEEPRRKSWWKKLDENSQDVMEVLEDNKLTINNPIEEFIDIEVLSQEKKNYTLDLPESSDNESINSIVLPQRRLFTQKENQPQKKFGHLIENRESLAKLHKTNNTNIEKTVNIGTRELFQNAKRSKPIFPAALLIMSPNKTAADKTKENVLADPKPQVRNLFGNRPANKRKNMFADFIVSESEDEIPDIQPKVFSFQKKLEQRRISSASRGREASPASSITTDIELDFRMMLPSSTMVENQLEDMVASTPVKRARLSKLSEAKESEAGTLQTNTISDKSKQSNKSASSKNKSKASPDIKDKLLNSSRTTRSMLKNASKLEESANTSIKQNAKGNKSKSKISSRGDEFDVTLTKSGTNKQSATLNKSQNQNKSKTRNSPKAIETEIEFEENVANVENAINNVTRVINKSTKKSLPNTTAKNESLQNKSVNEKKGTVTLKVHSKADKTVGEQYSADDNVDGNHELETDNVQNQESKDEEMADQEIDEEANNSREDMNDEMEQANVDEVNVSQENEDEANVSEDNHEDVNVSQENIEEVNLSEGNQEDVSVSQENEDEANESEGNQEDVNVSQKNEDEQNESQDVANESPIVENQSSKEEEEGNESEKEDDETNNESEEEDEANESQEGANESQEVENENEEEHDDEGNQGQDVENENEEEHDDEGNQSQEVEAEVNESHEVGNKSQNVEKDENESEDEDDGIQSKEVEAEVNDSQEVANESQEVANESQQVANESQEVENEGNESNDDEDQANESQDVDAEVNESHEIEEDANESREIEEEAHESHKVEADEAADLDIDEEMAEDEEEADNESEVNEASANESQDVENDEEESEAEVNESAEVEEDQQMEISDEADKAIASDPEISDQDDNQTDEMEVDDEEQESDDAEESEHREHVSHEERQIEEQNEVEANEEIDESPNVTHDTTGRHRKKHLNKSPEVILHDKTNQMDSFTAKGRNTSIRKTKSMIKNLNVRPSLAPARDSTGFSDGTKNSSAEGSGWDSHRTTRKTLRQTFGKDFTPRKSLRAMVMEKSAKRQTEHMEMHSETVKFPLANSTEMPEDSNPYVEDVVESDHELSRRTRQTTLEQYLQKIKEQNIEKKHKMEAAVRNSLKAPVTNSLSIFKVPNKPAPRRPKPAQSKPKKQLKSMTPFGELPSEVIEDLKYKPPKRFQPTNAPWITKRLYKFLETKLEPTYDYKARVRAEKLVETIYFFTKDLRRHDVAPAAAVDQLKHEFARLNIVRTHFEFYDFFHEFMPRGIRVKVNPDIVNKIALPRHGIFSDILRGNTVHG